MGQAYAVLGDNARAVKYLQQSLAIAIEVGDKRVEENAIANLKIAYADIGDERRTVG